MKEYKGFYVGMVYQFQKCEAWMGEWKSYSQKSNESERAPRRGYTG